MAESPDGYDRAFELLIEAMQAAKASVPNSDFVPALVDFAASVGLIADGEAGVRAMTGGMERRILDWQEGRFPAGRDGKKPKALKPRKSSDTVASYLAASARHQRPVSLLMKKIAKPARGYVDFVNADPDGMTAIDEVTREHAYAAMEAILASTMRRVIKSGIPLHVLLFSLADFLAMVTLQLTGEEAVLRLQMERIEGKIAEWRAGDLGAET